VRPVGVAVSVVGAILIGLLLTLLPTGPLSDTSVHAATSLQQQLQQAQDKLEQLRDQISKSEIARKAAEGDIAAIDENIDVMETEVAQAESAWESAQDKLDALQDRLSEVTEELASKRSELQRTQLELSAQQQQLEDRVVGIYKYGGNASYLVAFLSADSITEVAGRLQALETIADQDQTILSQIKALEEKVIAEKTALEQRQAEAAALEEEQADLTADLQTKAEQRQAALDDLESAKQAKEQLVATAEKNEAAWSKQEDELLAESNRISSLLTGASTGNPGTAHSGTLARPVPGAITSPFGMRMHPIFHVYKMHTGVDMHAGMGESIRSGESGTVVFAGWRGGYGKCTIVDHGGGLSTLYAHQSSILVSVGQKVSRGQVIGKVGSTGYSTGPHLHFEVRVNGSPVDPAPYL
jgi:murein DD-endopeptidase MepM/ murein hydrolase activator NlpD